MPNACEIYKSEDWGLSFKVGRHLVTMSAFRSEDYQPPALNQVFGDVVLKIIDRLQQIP